MNNDIQIAGCCVGDRVLALYHGSHIFNKITKIEMLKQQLKREETKPKKLVKEGLVK